MILSAQCDPEIEGIQTQLVDTTKNHCVDTVRSSGYWLCEAYPQLGNTHISLEIILTRTDNKIRETCTFEP